MSVIEQLRADLIKHIETADEQELEDVAIVLKAQKLDRDNDEFVVPQWQQEEMKRRVAARKEDPSLLISRDVAEKMIRKMTGK